MLSRHDLATRIRQLEHERTSNEAKIRALKRELTQSANREALLVEMVKRGQRAHERQIMSIALFKRRHKHN